jgi:hypothetical protein
MEAENHQSGIQAISIWPIKETAVFVQPNCPYYLQGKEKVYA